MPSDIVLYIFYLLTLLYLHLCLQTLDVMSLNINRQNRWYNVFPLGPEPTRLEAFSMYVRALHRAVMGKEAPHEGGDHFDLGPVEIYGGYPQADEAGDLFDPGWQENLGYDDAVPMPDMVEVIEPHAGGRTRAWQRKFDALKRRVAFRRR